MKSKIRKRLLALMLCLAMVLNGSVSALADDGTLVDDQQVVSEEVVEVVEDAEAITEEVEEVVEEETVEDVAAEETVEVVLEEVEEMEEVELVTEEENVEEITEVPLEEDLEAPQEIVQLYYEDEAVKITVSEAEVGAIPDGAILKVTPIVQTEITEGMTAEEKADAEEINDKYELTGQKLAESKKDAENVVVGFLAYDITFIDENGNEIEPNSEVKVAMEYKKASFPEAVQKENVVIDEVTVVHLEENAAGEVEKVVDMTESKQLEAIETNEDNEVQKAEFATNSFSIFTITWNGSNTLQARAVDENRANIGFDNTIVIQAIDVKEEVLLENLDANIEGYTYTGAYVANNTGVSRVTIYRIRYNGGWQYSTARTGNNWNNLSNTQYLYLQFSSGTAEKVTTADVNEAGITINLFDYNVETGGINSKNNGFYFHANDNEDGSDASSIRNNAISGISTYYSDGSRRQFTNAWPQSVYQGYLKFNLQGGYPVLNKNYDPTDDPEAPYSYSGNGISNDMSLAYLYDDDTPGVEAHTNLNGLFRKDANGYYYYDSVYNHAQLNGNIIEVYDRANGPGFFLPFNSYASNISERNRDLWFGMTVETAFIQPKAGQVNGQDMVFNFSGDDDVWVFIDGVKVLDIGGIHGKSSGTINFVTGEVSVQGTYEDYRNGWISEPVEYNTTIAECYEAAFNEAIADGATNVNGYNDVDEYLESIFNKDASGNYTSFKNYSSHNFKFFYFERGAGESNCMLKFNIPTVQKDSVTIQKEISNYADGAYSDVEFSFELYVEDDNGDLSIVKDKSYTLVKADGTEETAKVGADGIFKLKHNEKAVFNAVADQGKKYYAKEVGLNSEEYDRVVIESSGIVNENDESIIAPNQNSIRSENLEIGQDYLVVFQNQCAATNMKTLSVKKVLDVNLAENPDYEFEILIAGQPYVGEYKVGDITKACTNGIITLKAGEIATILGYAFAEDGYGNKAVTGIPSDTSFEVREINLDSNIYNAPVYSLIDAEITSLNDSAKGVIKGKNPFVTVTNNLQSTITVEKKWITNAIVESPIYIGLYKDVDGVLVPEAGTEVSLTNGNYLHTYFNRSLDIYTVRELRPIVGEEVADFTIGGVGYIRVDNNGIVEVDGVDYEATYASSNDKVTITNTQLWGKIVIDKVSKSDSNVKLSGAKFKLQVLDGTDYVDYIRGTTPYIVTTDGNGSATFEKLEKGKYKIVEIEAPAGYALFAEDVEVEIPTTLEGVVTYELVKTIQNTPVYSLPSSGGFGIYVYMIGGMMLMAFATFVLYKNRRKEILAR